MGARLRGRGPRKTAATGLCQNELMFEVLVYVYENYWRGDACPELEHLERKLSSAGFDSDQIREALVRALLRSTRGLLGIATPPSDPTPP